MSKVIIALLLLLSAELVLLPVLPYKLHERGASIEMLQLAHITI
jgi:hypothetical protein